MNTLDILAGTEIHIDALMFRAAETSDCQACPRSAHTTIHVAHADIAAASSALARSNKAAVHYGTALPRKRPRGRGLASKPSVNVYEAASNDPNQLEGNKQRKSEGLRKCVSLLSARLALDSALAQALRQCTMSPATAVLP